jgi:hypothetical protein
LGVGHLFAEGADGLDEIAFELGGLQARVGLEEEGCDAGDVGTGGGGTGKTAAVGGVNERGGVGGGADFGFEAIVVGGALRTVGGEGIGENIDGANGEGGAGGCGIG